MLSNSVLSRQLSFFVDEEVIKELDYTEIDLVGDLSDTIRIEDKIVFTVCMSYHLYYIKQCVCVVYLVFTFHLAKTIM